LAVYRLLARDDVVDAAYGKSFDINVAQPGIFERSIPPGAKIKSRSYGPVFRWMKSLPRRICAASSSVSVDEGVIHPLLQRPAGGCFELFDPFLRSVHKQKGQARGLPLL